MDRITQKVLENVVDRINRVAGTPLAPYAKDDNGKIQPQALNYHLDYAYGGVQLVQMSGTPGCSGIRTINPGHVSKRELYNIMQAFLNGLESGK